LQLFERNGERDYAKGMKNEGFGMCRKESAGSWGRGFLQASHAGDDVAGRSFGGKGRYHGNSAKTCQ
jgi:hypothetical protein